MVSMNSIILQTQLYFQKHKQEERKIKEQDKEGINWTRQESLGSTFDIYVNC